MEFYLMKEKTLGYITSGVPVFIVLRQDDVIQRYDTIHYGASAAADTNDPQYIKLKECIGFLKNEQPRIISLRMNNPSGCSNLLLNFTDNMLEIKLSSSLVVVESPVSGVGVVRDEANTIAVEYLRIKVELSGRVLRLLKIGFGDKLKIRVELHFETLFTETSKMQIKTQTEFKDFCEDGINILKILKNNCLQGQLFKINSISIVACLETPIDPQAEDVLALNKKILNSKVGTDCEIICGSGQRVACYSRFLIEQSEVFSTMLSSDMKEGETKEVRIDDMTLEGLKAFLNFIYYRGKESAEQSCGIAVELIKTGHKYMIYSLEKTMKEILMKKPFSWFNVDAALTLFFFADKVDHHKEDLKIKAFQALKTFSLHEVQSSVVFNHIIFPSGTAEAKEIFLFSLWN